MYHGTVTYFRGYVVTLAVSMRMTYRYKTRISIIDDKIQKEETMPCRIEEDPKVNRLLLVAILCQYVYESGT
jgi:hypothetical protein